MSGSNLDIVEAIDAEGGHAAIRVTGLSNLPPDPTFRIDPIDDALSQGDTDWPTGPRRPAAVKALAGGGFDLVLGPDVLESPLLAPGTAVLVSITDTAVEAELIWPSISSRRPRARRPVIVTEELRDAERVDTHRREAAAAVLAAATARVASATPSAQPAMRQKAKRTTTAPTQHIANSPVSSDGRVLSGFTPQLQSETSAAALIRKDGGRSQPLPGTALAPVAPAAPLPSRRGRQLAAFGGGLGLAALLMFSLVQFRIVNIQPVGQVATGTPDVALTLAKNSSTLRAVLATGGMSPRGRAAGGVDGGAALRLADAHLYGTSETPRDQGEASFWLRHALSQPIDHESMKWAYTQLGSVYAQPDGFEPDYAKARLLWEIASALGDPVAMCFNASLYEHGLGVPKHRDLARAMYERARNAGGCRGVDDALKRTN